MTIRRNLSKIVAAIQTVIGGLSIIFVFIMYYNVFGAQTIIDASAETFELYLWVFIIFGLLSAISALILFYQL